MDGQQSVSAKHTKNTDKDKEAVITSQFFFSFAHYFLNKLVERIINILTASESFLLSYFPLRNLDHGLER